MRLDGLASRRIARARTRLVRASCLLGVSVAASLAPIAADASATRATAARFPCSGPNAAHVPCHFATPSGNIRCLWTPAPDNVACELVASRRGFRLRPNGRARAISLNLHRRGETLPGGQQIVFPQSLSCRDTRTTITCNQDFGLGQFKLAPKR
jgi:hypothetical protein